MRHTYDQSGNAYHLKGGKHTCPQCGQHTLQLYIKEADGDPINDVVGKCDRHYNCGYNLKPWAYFEEHPDELPMKYKHKRTKPEPPKPLVTIPMEYVEKSMATAKPGQCDFIDIIMHLFPKEDVARVIEKYYLGTTKEKSVIFWQIDENGNVHEGKAMAYNPANGKRDKASWQTCASKWIFSTMQGRGLLPMDAASTKILFGQHLLATADKETMVCVTESEKNAIFGAIAFPDYVWLAVGSGQELGKLWKVRNIFAKCRCVILVPDSDAINEWIRKAEDFKLTNLKVWKLCQGHPDGWDIADYIRDKWLQRPQTITAYHRTTEPVATLTPSQPTTPPPPMENNVIVALCPQHRLERMAASNPAISLLVDKLQLEAIDDDYIPF